MMTFTTVGYQAALSLRLDWAQMEDTAPFVCRRWLQLSCHCCLVVWSVNQDARDPVRSLSLKLSSQPLACLQWTRDYSIDDRSKLRWQKKEASESSFCPRLRAVIVAQWYGLHLETLKTLSGDSNPVLPSSSWASSGNSSHAVTWLQWQCPTYLHVPATPMLPEAKQAAKVCYQKAHNWSKWIKGRFSESASFFCTCSVASHSDDQLKLKPLSWRYQYQPDLELQVSYMIYDSTRVQILPATGRRQAGFEPGGF